jgi:hypothetical protein
MQTPFFLRIAEKEGGLSKNADPEYDENVTFHSDASPSGI